VQLAQGDSIEVVDYCKGSYVPNENNDEAKVRLVYCQLCNSSHRHGDYLR